jgi:hypothetical protein
MVLITTVERLQRPLFSLSNSDRQRCSPTGTLVRFPRAHRKAAVQVQQRGSSAHGFVQRYRRVRAHSSCQQQPGVQHREQEVGFEVTHASTSNRINANRALRRVSTTLRHRLGFTGSFTAIRPDDADDRRGLSLVHRGGGRIAKDPTKCGGE